MATHSDFAQLRAFAIVGETLSFSRAAEALGISPSAASQLVRRLEKRVGARLLNRSTRSVSFTEAGRTLYDRVAQAVGTIDGAVEQTRKTGERPAGTLRVHSFRSGAAHYVRPMLAKFLAGHPDVTIDLTLDDTVVDIVAAGYDVALRLGEVIEKDMVAVRLGGEIRQVVVASPDYLERHAAPKTPRDLHEHACIRWRWPGELRPYDWELCENGTWFSVQVDGPLIVNDKVFAIEAALAGIGLAFVVEQHVQPLIASGELVPLLTAWSANFPGMFACYPERRQMAPALRAFIRALRATT